MLNVIFSRMEIQAAQEQKQRERSSSRSSQKSDNKKTQEVVMNGDIRSVTAEQDETDYNQNGGR